MMLAMVLGDISNTLPYNLIFNKTATGIVKTPTMGLMAQDVGLLAGPSKTAQWEGGIKSDWFNEKLRFNVTLFDIKTDNLAYQILDSNYNPVRDPNNNPLYGLAGTTNSCVAVMEGKDPVVIPNAEGKRTTPSIVAFTEDGERKVGDPAKRQAVTNPVNTVYSIKRFIGTHFKDDGSEIAKSSRYTPQEMSAMILSEKNEENSEIPCQEVTRAVITVPALHLTMRKDRPTKRSGEIAGLKVERIINEPTAALWLMD
ncbi:hypothetical protein FQR65_LT16383 [Abscondita terminalis]|nr:hypothetical protein FQR65_LT16383 [Abscondita terminalis]